uniref:Uncharacterized protein n=1 Tax=Klebsiella pneumoniae TaxID=573 RepID=A0A8E6L7B2_KLEPN|nr:hypothetical protein [Klebsiella pneumoniae]
MLNISFLFYHDFFHYLPRFTINNILLQCIAILFTYLAIYKYIA